jgi:SAM-dependent methyltransferase
VAVKNMIQEKSPSELNASDLVAKFRELRVVSGKYVPWHDRACPASASYASGFQITADTRPEDIPVPGPYPVLRHQTTEKLYLDTGGHAVRVMRSILVEDGLEFVRGMRVLDFGCYTGRLLRWFLKEARAGVEFWGVDIDAYAIDWASSTMAPPFQFAVTTTEPHLPFPDRYFDLAYAGSVFTHMNDLSVAWLLELRRVLKPGGRAYLTFNDSASADVVTRKYAGSYDQEKLHEATLALGLTLEEVNFLCIDQTPYSTIFYKREFLIARLQRLFQLKAIKDEAFGWQSAYLVQTSPM